VYDVKVFVSNFKVEKVNTWTTLSTFFTVFLYDTSKKRKKSRFLDFQKNVFSNYVWCPLSRKRLEIATWWQCSVYRKWPTVNQMVTWW